MNEFVVKWDCIRACIDGYADKEQIIGILNLKMVETLDLWAYFTPYQIAQAKMGKKIVIDLDNVKSVLYYRQV